MNLKGVIEDVDVFCLAVGQLLQNLDLMNGAFNGIVLGADVDLVVRAINVDDLESNHAIVDLIETMRDHNMVSRFSCGLEA